MASSEDRRLSGLTVTDQTRGRNREESNREFNSKKPHLNINGNYKDLELEPTLNFHKYGPTSK